MLRWVIVICLIVMFASWIIYVIRHQWNDFLRAEYEQAELDWELSELDD